MKSLKTAVLMLAAIPFLSSCLENDNPNAQIALSVNGCIPLYANEVKQSLQLVSVNEWGITADRSWCTVSPQNGKGGAVYDVNVAFEQNRSGDSRMVVLRATDQLYPTNAYAGWAYLQYATRGDGAFGNAPLVKRILIDDTDEVKLAYDDLCRPVSYEHLKNGSRTQLVNITYRDADSTVTVVDNGMTLTAKYTNGYQVERYLSQTDTIGYIYYANYMGTISPERIFNVEHRGVGQRTAYTYQSEYVNRRLPSLEPDSLHNADSLFVLRDRVETKYRLSYDGHIDNRKQSIDVNQLLWGVDNLEPLMLLSQFRYARTGYVISKAEAAGRFLTTTVTTRPDGGVSELRVTDSLTGKETVYKLEYE